VHCLHNPCVRHHWENALTDENVIPGPVRNLVYAVSSDDATSADPDDPLVRGFAEFGLPSTSPLATDDHLNQLQAWRDELNISPNSAFVDGTLLHTVNALLDWKEPGCLTPATLWELTAFVDALVCFDQLYCLNNYGLSVSHFNEKLGAQVLKTIPDNDVLYRVARYAAADGVSSMRLLRESGEQGDVWSQEKQAVLDGWRAVLGPDFPSDGAFYTNTFDIGMREKAATATKLADGSLLIGTTGISRALGELVMATHVPWTPEEQPHRTSLERSKRFASNATYRTYVNQGIANALALPYLPSTLRMPFRRLFVRRASEVQDELVSIAMADRIFAQQQPSSPLILPFFTAAVLQGAATRQDIWAQMARVRSQSAAFRHVRADLDQILERSQVSAEAVRFQNAIRDEALKLADIAGATQQSVSVALGVVAQTGIVPLAGALKVGVDAARGVGHSGSWTRIWNRLFHRHEYFLAQTNTQAIALTNALPQVQRLWEMPKTGGYLKRFADATQRIGHALRD
jgi:hypothetical protein